MSFDHVGMPHFVHALRDRDPRANELRRSKGGSEPEGTENPGRVSNTGGRPGPEASFSAVAASYSSMSASFSMEKSDSGMSFSLSIEMESFSFSSGSFGGRPPLGRPGEDGPKGPPPNGEFGPPPPPHANHPEEGGRPVPPMGGGFVGANASGAMAAYSKESMSLAISINKEDGTFSLSFDWEKTSAFAASTSGPPGLRGEKNGPRQDKAEGLEGADEASPKPMAPPNDDQIARALTGMMKKLMEQFGGLDMHDPEATKQLAEKATLTQ